MATVVPRAVGHDTHSLLSHLIVDVDSSVLTSSREDPAVCREVNSVQVVVDLILERVSALARRNMPVLYHTLRLGRHQHG